MNKVKQIKTIASASTIKSAWLNEGFNPPYHKEQKELLRRNWPTLHRAIEDLIVI